MFTGGRKLILIALFTALLIALVNVVWWFSYRQTAEMLDHQLGHRLAAVARAATVAFKPDEIDRIVMGDVHVYLDAISRLQKVRNADSLSEAFILDENYNYLATTLLEPDSVYFLQELNGELIDRVLFDLEPQGAASETYRSGNIYLRSAFAPLRGTDGRTLAALGVEANVDYFDALADLRANLYFASALSLLGGIVLGVLFLLVQRRLSLAEQKLFLGETHAHLGRMVAVVAHELKNPLMIIRGSAERLKKKTQMEEAGYVLEEVDRLNGIVTGYLDFASSGESLLTSDAPEAIKLGELAAGLKKHLTDKYRGTDISWVGDTPPPELTMVGHYRSLRQVLLNLLFNGVEACLSAEKPVEVGFTAREVGKMIEIGIVDHGTGLEGKELKKVFTPFYTTKQAGSGLGLYLSQRLIRQMGGTIRVESKPGQGARFVIELPKGFKS